MKFQILSILLFPLFFSCNQKPVSTNNKTEELEVIKERLKKQEEKELEEIAKEKSKKEEPFNFYEYDDARLDSIFRLSLDSMIGFLNVTEFETDTIIKNGFTYAMYGKAQDGFSDFVFVESMYADLLDSLKTPTYLYVKHKDKFELKNQFEFDEMSWRNSKIQRRDINFDKKTDILFQRPWFVNRMIADYLIIMDSDFERIKMTNSTYELLTNEKNKTVISFIDGGNCCTHHKIINKWQNDSLVEIRHLEKSYNHKEGGGILEEFKIKNGKEVKTKSQKVTFEDAKKYFENYQ
ncbi:hypothetical protein WAF17_11685 [Bernardetia sp. ABR2-2B]|uniref:hypothetical protein n=1 Tax=Bernardetia sp. ABR2-2B TaxID=3127472 RepID=UPI0030CF268C